MRTLLLWPFSILALLIRPICAPCAEAGYSQSYVIVIKGAVAGNETVSEKSEGNGNLLSASEHEMLISDGLETKRMAFTSKMLLSASTLAPISYSYNYTSGNTGDSCEVVVKENQVTRKLRRSGNTSVVTASFPPGTVILDFNVYHQYDFLARKYDSKKGGRQLFNDFVPVIGSDIPIALTFLGNSEIEYNKSTLTVKNYRIEFVGIWAGMFAVDKDDRLVRLQVPAQDLEVVRKDLFPETPQAHPDSPPQ